MTDSLGYGDLGIYGGLKAPTPRIDELAQQGVRFRDFQVEPGCTPSRTAFMTGRMAVCSGNDKIAPPGTSGGLHPKEVTLDELFKRVGYSTALLPDDYEVHIEVLPMPYPNGDYSKMQESQ